MQRVECKLMNIHHICVLGVCFNLARCPFLKKKKLRFCTHY